MVPNMLFRKLMTFFFFSTFLSPLFAQLPAFPGAEGFGSEAIGGRGGQVIFVTNLNDDGPGSFRVAVQTPGPRIVIFKVGGVIRLKSRLIIDEPYLTIAGQTAPGDGICIADYSIMLNGPTTDIIIRGLRSRHGDVSDEIGSQSDALGTHGTTPNKIIRKVIIDHCSLSWSIDETFQFWDYTEAATIQWSMITESLDNAGHPDGGPHGYAVLMKSNIDGGGFSFHHNLIAHHRSRNPKFSGSRLNPAHVTLYDYRNNVVYNHGTRPAMSGSTGEAMRVHVNFINNYYKFGPNTQSSKKNKLLLIQYLGNPQYYMTGNTVFNYPNETANNWLAVDYWQTALGESDIRTNTRFSTPPVTTLDADSAYKVVLDYAGATAPYRDPIDVRIINEIRNGTGSHIDSQSEVGGWPVYSNAAYPPDADNDGMPDAWESANGLNPNNPNDMNGDLDGDGYTNIEEYINSLIPLPPILNAAPAAPVGLRIQ